MEVVKCVRTGGKHVVRMRGNQKARDRDESLHHDQIFENEPVYRDAVDTHVAGAPAWLGESSTSSSFRKTACLPIFLRFSPCNGWP
jgi:hypothetical protein